MIIIKFCRVYILNTIKLYGVIIMIISMMSVGAGGEREKFDECVEDGLVVSQVL